VRDILATLPWVEPDSIKPNGKTRQVKLTVKDRAKFNIEDVRKALGSRYGDGVKVLTEPTEK
jgi:hypothetical protein